MRKLMLKAAWLLGIVSLAALLYVGALATMNGLGPVSLLIGETIDVRRHVTLEYSDPVFGDPPSIEKVWDAPSRFRIWGDDYLSPPAVSGGVAFVHAADCHLYAIDLATHSRKWGRDAYCYPDTPLITNGSVVIMATQPKIFAFDVGTGELVWERRELWRISTGHFYLENDTLFLPVTDQIVALDAMTGETRWTASVSGLSEIALNEGSIVVVSGAKLTGFDAQTGRQSWDIRIDGLKTIKAITADYGVIVVTDCEHQVVALGSPNFTEAWRFDSRMQFAPEDVAVGRPSDFCGAPLFLSQERVHVHIRQGAGWSWIALDMGAGAYLWTASANLDETALALCGRWICGIGAYGLTLEALDLESGKLAWRFLIEDPHMEGIVVSNGEGFLTNGDDLFRMDFNSWSEAIRFN